MKNYIFFNHSLTNKDLYQIIFSVGIHRNINRCLKKTYFILLLIITIQYKNSIIPLVQMSRAAVFTVMCNILNILLIIHHSL